MIGNTMPARKEKSNCFPPIARADARVLILGSLPGGESLRRRQYYALPQNAFWRIMGQLLGFSAGDTPYPKKVERLLEHRIAVWDVCAAAHRIGSLDSAIRDVETNDFAHFFESHREIELVCFNGSTAEMLFTRAAKLKKLETPGVRYLRLPSTSPAHAGMRFEEKYAAWAGALWLVS